MSFNKSVQKIFFMLAISISAVLLCIVGVWAATTMNLSFKGSISPDIYCKITSGDNGDIPIFNNYNQAEGGKPITNGNTLSTSVTLTAGVTNEIKFQLTSYTENKYIRLSVADISGATIENNAVAVCENGQSKEMTIFVAGDSQATTATISLKVEEVYQVKVAGTGLALDATDNDATYDYYYFAPGDNRQITLEPMVGYQLPTTINVPDSTTYRKSNTQGTVTIPASSLSRSGLTLTVDCNQIFAIKQSDGVSMLNNQATTIENPVYIDVYKKTTTIDDDQTTTSELKVRFDNTNPPSEGDKEGDNTTTTVEFEKTLPSINSGQYFIESEEVTYLPNNGKYYRAKSVDGETTYIVLEAGFIEYPYYVEMGLYPQKAKTKAGTPTWNANTQKYHLDDDTYALIDDTYYLYEPIKWIVLGTQDSTYSLSELKFQNGMLYTDGARGKPYTGQLVLMSAYVLESSAYNYSQSSTQKFSTSSVASWLQDPFGLSSTGENGITLKNAASIDDGQYLKKQSLDSQAVTSTYNNSAMSNTFNKDNMETAFFLLGGVGKATLTDETSVDEKYYAGTYFNVGGIYEGKGQSTFNVGVTSPTAYAIATGVECGESIIIAGLSPATATRGWGEEDDNRSTCAYWTRSGGESFGAFVISMQGQPVNVSATNDNVGVRPMVVLDMGFYETGTYTETNNAQAQSET